MHSAEVSYCVEDQLVGLCYLGHPSKSLSLGGELYYLISERSGGLSFGMRKILHSPRLQIPQHLTFTWNPIMGHTSMTSSLSPQKGFTFSSRLDYNVFSFESDLTLGVLFSKSAFEGFQFRYSFEKVGLSSLLVLEFPTT